MQLVPGNKEHQHNCEQTECPAQLEFVQILVIVMVMMVMVVVITCVLNRYRRSARSLLTRHGSQRRPHLPLASEGGPWSSEGAGPSSGQSEQQVFTARPPERVPSYLQRELGRFQPTYPYLPQSLIDLPPTISLSDGEEPPPYQGPCTLQLRDPEQQLELNRESVRAPPNRTVYDSHLLDSSHCPQAPPHLHQGGGGGGGLMATSAAFGSQGARVHGAPPTYSEVIGHYYHPSSMPSHPHQTGGSPHPPSLLQGLLPNISPSPGSLESRNARNSKEKHSPQQV